MYFTGEEQNPKPNQNNKKQSANKKKNHNKRQSNPHLTEDDSLKIQENK